MNVYNDGITISIQDPQTLDTVRQRYIAALRDVKVRTFNVLDAWRAEFPSDKEFLEHFLSASSDEIHKRKNCGRLTLEELQVLRNVLRDEVQYDPTTSESTDEDTQVVAEDVHFPSNIDELLPLFKSTYADLSTRSANRVDWLLEECGNSLSKFYERISDPKCIDSISGVGRKSRPELIDFFKKAKDFLLSFPDEESISAKVKHHLVASPSALGLPDGAIESLQEMEESLGHFPLFAAIQQYFENRPDEEKAIIEGCLDIYDGQELPERTDVATSLNLSPERVRQKRNKLIERLPAYFKTYSSLGFITENPYRWQMTHAEEEINATEGTNFNLNFVTWVLGNVFDDLVLIGDPVKSIGGYFDLDPFLSIVPAKLLPLFDFEGFIQDLDDRLQEKRINEEKVSLRSIIAAHLKVQYCEEELPEIDTTCRTILYLHYPVEVDQGYVLLPANAYKTNQIIMEEILREAGQPMTLAEMMDEYMYQYPERDANENSLRGAIGGNKNIVPVGRSSTYALAEWNREVYRGGTIRQFVQECIDLSPLRIASVSEVADYVLRFRPGTSELNIVSNISLDPDKALSFYYKDGVRYLGYANHIYPDEYFPLESDSRTSSTNSVYYPRFVEFIETNHRFPFSTGRLPDEPNLHGFWRRQERYYNDGILDSHALKWYERIVTQYGHLKIEKGEFEWMVQFAHVAKQYDALMPEEEYFLLFEMEVDRDKWFKSNMHDYYYRAKYIPEYRVEKLRRLEEHISSMAQRLYEEHKIEHLNVQDNLG